MRDPAPLTSFQARNRTPSKWTHLAEDNPTPIINTEFLDTTSKFGSILRNDLVIYLNICDGYIEYWLRRLVLRDDNTVCLICKVGLRFGWEHRDLKFETKYLRKMSRRSKQRKPTFENKS